MFGLRISVDETFLTYPFAKAGGVAAPRFFYGISFSGRED